MRFLMLLFASMASVVLMGVAQTRAACDPVGDVQFVCGPANAEDMVLLPATDWIIASGLWNPGNLQLVNVRDQSTTVLFPADNLRQRPDTKMYHSCPGSINPAEKEGFRTHGLSLRAGTNGVHTLYVVHHGDREAIEVLEVDARGKTPTLTWIGCAVAPPNVSINAVVALSDGGFAATNFVASGNVWEWHPETAWRVVPGSEIKRPNGLEVSRDGKWFYISGWDDQTLTRISRGQTPVKKDVVRLGFFPDNLRWAPDGSLFAAGPGASQTELSKCFAKGGVGVCSTEVVKIHPDTLKFHNVIHYPSHSAFPYSGTTAIQVGNEIWVSSSRGDRIARFLVK